MRQGQQNKRMRGRSRKGPNPLTRSFESNGPDVKIRGTALHIAEKYVQLARDAQTSGDRVAGESYLQHAEHFFRIVAAAQAQMPQPQVQPQSNAREGSDEDEDSGAVDSDRSSPSERTQQPSFGLSDPQPFPNGNGQGGPQGEADDESGNAPSEDRVETREQTDQRDNRESGSHRGRRRRPYRERVSNDQAEPRGEAPSTGSPEPAVDAAPNDD
jgi:hypothetical protein